MLTGFKNEFDELIYYAGYFLALLGRVERNSAIVSELDRRGYSGFEALREETRALGAILRQGAFDPEPFERLGDMQIEMREGKE